MTKQNAISQTIFSEPSNFCPVLPDVIGQRNLERAEEQHSRALPKG